jgi:hypothetical protein
MARTALLVLRVNRGHRAHRDPLVNRDRRERKGKQAPRVNRGLKVTRGNRDRRVSRDLPENRGRRVRKGMQVPRGFRALKEIREFRGRRGQPDHRERLVYRVNGVPPGIVQRSASQSSPVAIVSR